MENIYSTAGAEFGDKEDAVVLIKEALYGFSTSARQWSLALGDQIRDIGIKPTRADPDLGIKKSEIKSKYEYMATYVDDIIIVANDPMKYLNKLKIYFQSETLS